MKTRWKILLIIFAFLTLLAGSSLLTMHVQPANKLEAYKKFLRDQGEKLTISEVLPPPVPAESNSVSAVEAAFSLLGASSQQVPDAMKMVAPGKALIGWRQPVARGADFTNSWDDFRGELALSQPGIELLHQVLERPKLDFQLDYKKGAELLLPHLAPMKRAAQKLEAAAVGELHGGNPGEAATNILALVGLVQRNASEGLLISHLVRIAIAAIAVAPTWELLQATNVTDAQLAAVQHGWEQMNFLRDAQNAFGMERAWMLEAIQKARSSHAEFAKIVPLSVGSSSGSSSVWTWPPDLEAMTEQSRETAGEMMWRSSWSYADELRSLQINQTILETLRMMQTNQSQFYKADYDAMITRLSTIGRTNIGGALFRALKIPDFGEIFGDYGLASAVSKAVRMETARRVVATAVALKRFQLAHGKLPETLSALVPDFLQAVPIDPNDGKPLRYHPNADGSYLLYSVGEDGVDDGGDANIPAGSASSSLYWQNNHARDWVWPQPATEAEIKFFYEHLPK